MAKREFQDGEKIRLIDGRKGTIDSIDDTHSSYYWVVGDWKGYYRVFVKDMKKS